MVFCIANVIGNAAINGKSYEMRIELMMVDVFGDCQPSKYDKSG
jgi:hypothetical protein